MQNQPPSTLIIESSNFTSKLSKQLLSFSDNEKFSDICIITSDDVRFHAHKCVLSAFSSYFMLMFESDKLEPRISEIKIHEITGNVFKPILTFLYTGRIEFQSDTVKDILKAAKFIHIAILIDECYNFMGVELDVKNCFDIATIANHHGLVKLSKKASKFISEHFESASREEGFLKLEEDQLSAIVASEDLCVISEEVVFFNIIKWIDYDKPNREKSALDLISKVRYWLLSVEFIKQHRSKLPYQVECLELVCNWLEWHSLPESRRELKVMTFSKPRSALGIVFVGGGAIQSYDPELNIWTRKEVPNLPNAFDKVIAFKNKLIFAHGDNPLTCFDLQMQEITHVTPKMNTPRRNYGLTVLNGELYAIGGQDTTHSWTNNVEKYNFKTGKWYYVAPMNNKLDKPKAAVADCQLYVVGNNRITIMECFNPITNEWTGKSFLSNRKYFGFGFTEVGGKLYTIGGKWYTTGLRRITLSFQKSLYSYQPQRDLWQEESQMEIKLNNPHCISWNNRLITCGGGNLIQEYNPTSKEWKTLPALIDYDPSAKSFGLVAFE